MSFGAKAILAVVVLVLLGLLVSLLLPILAIIGAITICWFIFKLLDHDPEDEDEKKPP